MIASRARLPTPPHRGAATVAAPAFRSQGAETSHPLDRRSPRQSQSTFGQRGQKESRAPKPRRTMRHNISSCLGVGQGVLDGLFQVRSRRHSKIRAGQIHHLAARLVVQRTQMTSALVETFGRSPRGVSPEATCAPRRCNSSLYTLKPRPPSSFPQPAVPRPSPRETPETLPYAILSRLSSPRIAAPRLAAHRCGKQPLDAGAAASAASTGWPPAAAGDGKSSAKRAFKLPIRSASSQRKQGRISPEP